MRRLDWSHDVEVEIEGFSVHGMCVAGGCHKRQAHRLSHWLQPCRLG